jgi:hypothetical protein
MNLAEAAAALGMNQGALWASLATGRIIGAGRKDANGRWQFTDDDIAGIRELRGRRR